jgi:glycerophosphoryl diester phosphodiesterase
MKIIAHRGYWIKHEEKNTITAFRRALENGYGIETDIRDLSGDLVISHDPAQKNSIPLSRFIEECVQFEIDVPHALNIKSDGLQKLLHTNREKYHNFRYFVFDMSIPDTLQYAVLNEPFFVRRSEYENPSELLLRSAAGVWLDAFHKDWFTREIINLYLAKNLMVCIVSPELHGRPHNKLWNNLKVNNLHKEKNLMLCTDYPEDAKEFFI